MEFWIKIGLCFVWRIGLLILSGFNTLSLVTKFCGVLLVALNWMEGRVGNQVSQQNNTYLCRYEVKSVGEKSFVCLFWLSALLLPFKLNCGCLYVGWHWRGLMTLTWLLILSFFAVLYKWTIPEELFRRNLAWKSPSSGHRVKRGLNALISLCLCRFLDSLGWFFFVLHTKRRYMYLASFLDF